MLKIYDPLDEVLALNRFAEMVPMHFYASELAEKLGCTSADQLNGALNRTFNICETLGISVRLHFRKVYLYQDGQIYPDWKLSNLACYLLMINGNPCSPHVAEAQLFFMFNRTS